MNYKFGLLAVLAVLSPLYAQDATLTIDVGWFPVTDVERSLAAPTIDRNAGAEALFWRTHVWDELTGQDWRRIYSHYTRIKVFNEKGKEQVSTVDIVTYRKDTAIQSIAARTIRPDGTIVEMSKDAVKDRDVIRAGGLSVRAKSFTLPAVEPGAIIEYRYREIAFKEDIIYLRGQFQHDIPVQKSTFLVRPLPRDLVPLQMAVMPFNCRPSKLKLENSGFNSTTLENVPAFLSEPYMPGEASVRPWILIYYAKDLHVDPDKYWQKEGKDAYNELKESLRLNNEIKRAAAKATSGAATPSDKAIALIAYLRANLRDLFSSAVTDAERGKVFRSMPKTRHRTSVEVFESGIGTANELNVLFAAMAQSVGLDARPVRVGSRDDIFFHPNVANIHFLQGIDMTVNIDGKWKVYDVSARELPPDMVGWREEGAKALLSDPKTPHFIDIPISPPGASRSERKGAFRLKEDGLLEGDVKLQYTGHRAADRRKDRLDEPVEKLIESYKRSIEKLYAGAEVSTVKIENLADSTKPLTYSYHIRIPAYAQRTGKRVFFHPLYFQRATTPLFSGSERNYDIQVPYAWHDEDEVRIEFPEGYQLENPENPGGLAFGAPGEYQLRMTLHGHTLVVNRRMVFGDRGVVYFPKAAYMQVKKVFDEVHRRDTSMLALKQVGQ